MVPPNRQVRSARSSRFARATLLTALAVGDAALGQSSPPDYDFQWATIGASGNAPYAGYDPNGEVTGRGGVNYQYRMSKLEVTTSQWMEFVNDFADQPALLQPGGPLFVWGPAWWGAVHDGSYTGPGIRFQLDPSQPHAGLVPVNAMCWRDAALFCNWLNNGKPTSWAAIQNGAYDASTFTTNPDGTINDQATHNPGAKFWIPTLDEWLKAAHYDPNRYGTGQGGWWSYSTTSETAPVSGPPGSGQTDADLQLPDFGEYRIPLGAYAHAQSPWGLWDTSGGTSEWLEDIFAGQWRVWDGSTAGVSFPGTDNIWTFGAERPDSLSEGLRIASAVPGPGSLLMIPTWFFLGRRSR